MVFAFLMYPKAANELSGLYASEMEPGITMQTQVNIRRIALRAWLSAGALLTMTTLLADEGVLDRQLAEAKPYQDSFSRSQARRWDFDFGDGTALLRKDGTWRVEALISHGGLRCGTYRLGVRFGAGKPGCLDVNWFGKPIFVTRQKHCNNADRPHMGEGYDALLSDTFDEITCAERVIRCKGLCSARSQGEVEPAPRFGD